MTIRFARPNEGPGIAKLFVDMNFPVLDWDSPEIAHWWVVAEHAGEIIGAIQVIASFPIGFIGELIVDPKWRAKTIEGRGHAAPKGAAVGQALWLTAEALLKRSGIRHVSAAVLDRPGYRRIVERHGWRPNALPTVVYSKELA